jgi:hypothetical protein
MSSTINSKLEATDTINKMYSSSMNFTRENNRLALIPPDEDDTTTVQERNPPPLVDGLPAPYPPVPPPAPRYCTRQSKKQMENTSNELTRKELEKLQLNKTPSVMTMNAQQMGVPSHTRTSSDTNVVQMMQSYTQMCNHMNNMLEERSRNVQEVSKIQKELHDKQIEFEHLREISDSYEEDIQVLTEERDTVRQERDQYRFATHEALQEARHLVEPLSVQMIMYFVCCILLTFQINYAFELDMQSQYSLLVDFLKSHFWVIAATCFVHEEVLNGEEILNG